MELLISSEDLNPWHNLQYEAALESLGVDFYQCYSVPLVRLFPLGKWKQL